MESLIFNKILCLIQEKNFFLKLCWALTSFFPVLAELSLWVHGMASSSLQPIPWKVTPFCSQVTSYSLPGEVFEEIRKNFSTGTLIKNWNQLQKDTNPGSVKKTCECGIWGQWGTWRSWVGGWTQWSWKPVPNLTILSLHGCTGKPFQGIRDHSDHLLRTPKKAFAFHCSVPG